MACQKCQTRLVSDSRVHQLSSFGKGASYRCVSAERPLPKQIITGDKNVPTDTSDSLKSKLTSTRTSSPQEKVHKYGQVTDNDRNAYISRKPIPPANHRGPGGERRKGALTKAELRDDPAISFVMLTESQIVLPQPASRNRHPSQLRTSRGVSNDLIQSPSQQIEYKNRLFDIISSRSDIDHPICIQCSDILSSSIKSRISTAGKERDAYLSFLKDLNDKAPTPSEVSNATSSLASKCTAESKAVSVLLALEQEKSMLDAELDAAEAESLALDREEKIFWHSYNSSSSDLSSIQQHSEALNAAYDHDMRELDRLLRTNVMDDKISCREQSKYSVRHPR